MSEAISGVAGQIFQQALENQTLNQQTTESSGKRSFESYMKQDNPAQIQQDSDQTKKAETIDKTQSPTTSGAEMQKKLDQMEAELADRFKQNNQQQDKFDKMLPELLDSKSRLGLLKEAYSKIGSTSKVTNDLGGRFVQVENEYKQVEAIMRSDKNLSTGELLALQARLYQVSQHIEVMSKVVDQMAGGIKTILNTNV
jgi:hypothetical protein